MSVVLGIGFLLRNSILTFITESIKSKNASEAQSLQHAFEENMNAVRTELNQRVQQQDRVLATALEVSSERSKLISQKEVAAVEAIWASARKLDAGLLTAHTADLLNIDAIEDAPAGDKEGIKELAATISGNFSVDTIKEADCHWARLFVTETAWALYGAYSGIIVTGAIKMKAVELGVGASTTFDNKEVYSAILRALPHQQATLEKHPNIRSTLFLDELRRALISELRKSLHGKSETPEQVRRAQDILEALQPKN